MAWAAVLFLNTIHYIYSVVILFCLFWRRLSWTAPHPLRTARSRLPKHLAVVFVIDPKIQFEACIVQSVTNLVEWCRTAGIEKLTIYEEHGALLKCSQDIREKVCYEAEESCSESEIEYPLTPPPSDYSDSRPISPQHDIRMDMQTVTIHLSDKQKKRNSCRNSRKDTFLTRRKDNVINIPERQLILCLASRQSSKPLMASLAQSLVSRERERLQNNPKYRKIFNLGIDELDTLLESNYSLSSPDFMIVHSINPLQYNRASVELHGYPPWYIRLTEIHHHTIRRHPENISSSLPTPLDETSFNEALDEFATAEMRFGK